MHGKRSKRDLFELKGELSRRGDRNGRRTPQGQNPYRAAGLATSIPFALAVWPVMGYFAGWYLDSHFHTGYWTPIAVVMGLAGSIRLTVSLIRELSR